MERRTFIKTVILGVPGLCLDPLGSLGGLSPARLQAPASPEFAIFFIGTYGRAVMASFHRLRRIDPILKACEHVTMDSHVHSAQGLYEIAAAADLMPLLAEAARLRLGCLVYDAAAPGAAATAQWIASMLKTPENLIMSISPRALEGPCSHPAFDFEFTTALGGIDFTPGFLLTIHNTFLGCAQFGAFTCLKYHIEFLKSARRHRKGQVSVAFCEQGPVVPATLAEIAFQLATLSKMVVQAASLPQAHPADGILGAFWGILEISYKDFQHLQSLDFYDRTSEQLHRLSRAYEGCLLHPSLTGTKLKLSLVEWR